jgi:hypothetical protein
MPTCLELVTEFAEGEQKDEAGMSEEDSQLRFTFATPAEDGQDLEENDVEGCHAEESAAKRNERQ